MTEEETYNSPIKYYDNATEDWKNIPLIVNVDGKQDTLIGEGDGQNIKTINNNNILGSGNIDIQGGSSGDGTLPQYTFTDLQNIIDEAESGDIIYLNGYFEYDSSKDNLIIINKSLNIIGKGCIINGSNISQGMDLYSSNITLKNLQFINCLADHETLNAVGGAISFGSSRRNIKIENCIFENCIAKSYGGAIHDEGYDTKITNCVFKNCVARGENGGGIKSTHNTNIKNCIFDNCSGRYPGGGAIAGYPGNPIVEDCIFLTSSDTTANCTVTYTSLEDLKDGERPTTKAIKDYIDSLLNSE